MILALHAAGPVTYLWLILDPQGKDPEYALEWESGRALSEQLLGKIVGFIESHHRKLTELTGIVVFSGPGSFTSLRIGHTTVNAIADSLNIPVVGARGDNWRAEALERLGKAKLNLPILPYYGSEAHITKPKS
jgi:tRNA threonylcarbamoyladenosine biosynthesis protein TsaB